MSVVLTYLGAVELAEAVASKCREAGVLSSVVIMLPGGKQLADRNTAGAGQFTRVNLVRELCILTVQGREDIPALPEEWVERQRPLDFPAPALVGATRRIYVKSGTTDTPNYQFVGVIGLLGMEAAQATELLGHTLTSHGFLLSSDLPQAGAQG